MTATCMDEPATIEGTDEGEEIDGTDGRDVIVAGTSPSPLDG